MNHEHALEENISLLPKSCTNEMVIRRLMIALQQKVSANLSFSQTRAELQEIDNFIGCL